MTIALHTALLIAVIALQVADETLSARAHRMRVKGQRYWSWTADAIDTLFFWQPGHCRQSHEDEMARAQLPRPYWTKRN